MSEKEPTYSMEDAKRCAICFFAVRHGVGADIKWNEGCCIQSEPSRFVLSGESIVVLPGMCMFVNKVTFVVRALTWKEPRQTFWFVTEYYLDGERSPLDGRQQEEFEDDEE